MDRYGGVGDPGDGYRVMVQGVSRYGAAGSGGSPRDGGGGVDMGCMCSSKEVIEVKQGGRYAGVGWGGSGVGGYGGWWGPRGWV